MNDARETCIDCGGSLLEPGAPAICAAAHLPGAREYAKDMRERLAASEAREATLKADKHIMAQEWAKQSGAAQAREEELRTAWHQVLVAHRLHLETGDYAQFGMDVQDVIRRVPSIAEPEATDG